MESLAMQVDIMAVLAEEPLAVGVALSATAVKA